MKKPIFNAEFITADGIAAGAVPYFKKCFKKHGEINSAKLFISSLGVFVAKINGKRVGDDYMTPGWTNYKKRLQFLEYDVGEMLMDENEIVVGVGAGWYSGICDFRKYGDSTALILALRIEYTDGTSEIIMTDETWQVARSEVLFSGIYDGECVDARVVPSFDSNAQVLSVDKTVLTAFEGEKTKAHERLAVKELIITPKGEYVLDFGQEITGTFDIHIENAKGGECLTVECAEVLDKDGNFYNENYRAAKSRLVYTARAGEQSYRPTYTFYGFRYLRLSNWCEAVKKENFSATVLHSELKRTGTFECGHKKLEQLYANVIWGQRDNFLDVPTDCPQRDERLGWTGDAQVFARTAAINYDVEKFFAKWLRDMKSEQHADGGIPHVIPDVEGYERSCSAAWADAACIIPWEIYKAYGNKELLKEHLPMMRRWVGYMRRQAGRRYLWDSDDDKQFGDWLGLDAPKGSYTGSTDSRLIRGAFFYHSTQITLEACRVLGYKTDDLERLLQNVKKAFLKEFIKDGALVCDTQTAHVLTLHFGLIDHPVLKKRLSERLVALVEERGDALATGFVGTPYILDTLTEIGRADKAYKLLLREDFPSWLYSVNRGATTVWEHWDGIDEEGKMWSADMNSFNHYAYGSVASWLYRTVLGIIPTEAGYASLLLSPIPTRALGYVSASIETRRGRVESSWRYEADTVHYSFTVPTGVSARIVLPDGTEAFSSGGILNLDAAAVD